MCYLNADQQARSIAQPTADLLEQMVHLPKAYNKGSDLHRPCDCTRGTQLSAD